MAYLHIQNTTLCAMRDLCSCVHQGTIAPASRAFCAMLAHNVGIVRKTSWKEGRHLISVPLAAGKYQGPDGETRERA